MNYGERNWKLRGTWWVMNILSNTHHSRQHLTSLLAPSSTPTFTRDPHHPKANYSHPSSHHPTPSPPVLTPSFPTCASTLDNIPHSYTHTPARTPYPTDTAERSHSANRRCREACLPAGSMSTGSRSWCRSMRIPRCMPSFGCICRRSSIRRRHTASA